MVIATKIATGGGSVRGGGRQRRQNGWGKKKLDRGGGPIKTNSKIQQEEDLGTVKRKRTGWDPGRTWNIRRFIKEGGAKTSSCKTREIKDKRRERGGYGTKENNENQVWDLKELKFFLQGVVEGLGLKKKKKDDIWSLVSELSQRKNRGKRKMGGKRRHGTKRVC